MAKVLVTEDYIQNIASAIRSKNGLATTYRPGAMAQAILNIPSEQHPPINIQFTTSEHQEIDVTTKFLPDSVLGMHTSDFTIECPSSLTLNVEVIPDDDYMAGTPNQNNVTAIWGSTKSFSASAAQLLPDNPTVTRTIISSGNTFDIGDWVVWSYTFTGPSKAADYDIDLINSHINTPKLDAGEIYTEGQSIEFNCYISEADILARELITTLENSDTGDLIDVTILNANNLAAPLSQITIARDPISETGIIVSNTGNLTLTNVNIVCTNTNFTDIIASLAPGIQSNIYLDLGNFSFETVSVTADTPDPNNPNYTTSQTIYFDPTL